LTGPAPSNDGLKTIFDAVSAAGTAIAALFAAVSAWMAYRSANAAQVSAYEARRMRQEEILPRLVLEKDFLDFCFFWPHPASLNGEPVFLARKDWKDSDPSPPTFSITNYGERPALELEIIFDLDDANGEMSVPAMFAGLGLSVMAGPGGAGQGEIASLQFSRPHGTGTGLPLFHRMTADFPNCAPGQTRRVEFPMQLMSRLFLRGLQYWERRGRDDAIRDLILTVHMKAHSIDEQLYETQFRFRIVPFFQGQTKPLTVVGHCFEMPMYPKSDPFRMAQ